MYTIMQKKIMTKKSHLNQLIDENCNQSLFNKDVKQNM